MILRKLPITAKRQLIAKKLGVTDAQLLQLAKAVVREIEGKPPSINEKGRELLATARRMGW